MNKERRRVWQYLMIGITHRSSIPLLAQSTYSIISFKVVHKVLTCCLCKILISSGLFLPAEPGIDSVNPICACLYLAWSGRSLYYEINFSLQIERIESSWAYPFIERQALANRRTNDQSQVYENKRPATSALQTLNPSLKSLGTYFCASCGRNEIKPGKGCDFRRQKQKLSMQ